jgi:hypothetical protein
MNLFKGEKIVSQSGFSLFENSGIKSDYFRIDLKLLQKK